MDKVTERGASVVSEMEVTIRNTQGLHARPAAQFVRVAAKYPKAEVTVTKESLSVNGKSIIGIIMLEAGCGTRLQLRAQGEGARELLNELQKLIDGGFGEEMA